MSFEELKPICKELEGKPGCIQTALSILGDKWSPLLLGHLINDSKTFSELETALNGISPRTLSTRLHSLETKGIVTKEKYCARPPRYQYSLTKKGHDLKSILTQMSAWGEKYSTKPTTR